MESIYRFMFWILVICYPAWSQKVDGGYSQWYNWFGCSRSCGGGARYLYRYCNNPRPANGGQDCRRLGPNVKSQSCNTQKCPVDGGYSPWSNWGVCSKSCDGGTHTRFRTCTNPPPAYGGKDCSELGKITQTKRCITNKCTATANSTCQNTAGDDICKSWEMYCKDSKYARSRCAKTCGICQGLPINGGYSQWSDWTRCSRSCTEGTQQRFRTCTSPTPANGAADCRGLGPATESRKCFVRRCPVHGGYSQWSSWYHCTKSCGAGTQHRFRSCTNPPPVYDGRNCSRLGQATGSRRCNTHRCPVHGGYSQWSSWSRCSRSCDGGAQNRSRSCTNPPPVHGGRNCSGLGRANEFGKCNTHNCPVHGGYSRWSPWDQCSRSCGGGTQYHIRYCNNPQPAHGGRSCWTLGPAVKLQSCNTHTCPVHGGYSPWSRWGVCSKSCDGGNQTRSRTCANPPPAHGGRSCRRLGPATQTQRCNTHKCPARVPPTVIAVPPIMRLVFVGDSATFTCNASGVPTPNITWYRDGKQIKSSHYEISSITASSSQLTINNASHADNGHYVCRASLNAMEQAYTRYFLGVIKVIHVREGLK